MKHLIRIGYGLIVLLILLIIPSIIIGAGILIALNPTILAPIVLLVVAWILGREVEKSAEAKDV